MKGPLIPKSRKSQSSIEFISLAAFMTLVILGFFVITSSKILDAKDESNKRIAQDIAEFAYKEIEIATSVGDGYTRYFLMPQTINGINYSINITDNRELITNYLGHEYIKFIPTNVSGSIGKGLNLIYKKESMVFINASQLLLPPSLINLLMKNNFFSVISFDRYGNVILKGTLETNANPQLTADSEFAVMGGSGAVAVLNLKTGEMAIKGSLSENVQGTLQPQTASSDFILKNLEGEVVSFIDDSGNFYLKGALTQNGNP